jgi:SanA protein
MFIRILKISLFILFSLLFIPRVITAFHTWFRHYEEENVPHREVAIVFGAGLRRDGSPTAVLRDRVATAADLYRDGKVEKILMSGDNSYVEYNEPAAMQAYAVSLGVPSEDIVLDYAGRRTYDTCYRAREIFRVDNAILVTQNFHLPRALYTCNAIGIDAVGVPADRRNYTQGAIIFWNIRELPASLTALLEVHILKPLPIMGQPEPIFPLEAQ